MKTYEEWSEGRLANTWNAAIHGHGTFDQNTRRVTSKSADAGRVVPSDVSWQARRHILSGTEDMSDYNYAKQDIIIGLDELRRKFGDNRRGYFGRVMIEMLIKYARMLSPDGN